MILLCSQGSGPLRQRQEVRELPENMEMRKDDGEAKTHKQAVVGV